GEVAAAMLQIHSQTVPALMRQHLRRQGPRQGDPAVQGRLARSPQFTDTIGAHGVQVRAKAGANKVLESITTTCVIAGGGPAGMMCGFLLARAGGGVTGLGE